VREASASPQKRIIVTVQVIPIRTVDGEERAEVGVNGEVKLESASVFDTLTSEIAPSQVIR
jgi:hypothetical protein